MKKKALFFILIFALFSSLFMLSSCAKENKNFEGLSFEDKSVMYDGQAHGLEVTGSPDFAKVSYTANSFTEVGVYEVTATVTAEGYNDWSKTSKLYILSPEGGVSVDGFEFGWKEVGKEYKITGYTGEEAILYIPDTFNGLPVTEIGVMAFNLCNNLKYVFYCGNQKDYRAIYISSDSYYFEIALHFYSETEPPLNEDGTAYDGQYWRYVDGVPTAWVK